MRSKVLAGSRALFVAGMLLSLGTRAEPASSDANRGKDKASAHFERGVALAREGKLEAAVLEFEGAYRAHPHYSVLFNLGQARAAMGQSVEAVDAFRRYLDEGGTAIDRARRAHVLELVAFHEKRIGSLELVVEPDGAEIWIDGRLLGTSPVSRPVKLAEGTHSVSIRKDGFGPVAGSVRVEAGSTAKLALRVERVGAPQAGGLLVVRCGVPDVEVSIGGSVAGTTSSTTSFRAPIGATSIRLSRSGYVADARTVDISSARPSELDCRLKPDEKGPRGSLHVRSNPADAVVWVDGERFRSEALPIGRHAVRVERSGYHPFSAFVRIEAAKTAQLAAELRPTQEQQAAWQRDRSNRTAWAIATTIGGVVLAGTAAATFVWNNQRYDRWLVDRRALDGELVQQPATAAMLDENSALNQRALGIQRADVAALGLGVVAAVTLGISGALWVGVARGTDP
jgi:hypothetical protein